MNIHCESCGDLLDPMVVEKEIEDRALALTSAYSAGVSDNLYDLHLRLLDLLDRLRGTTSPKPGAKLRIAERVAAINSVSISLELTLGYEIWAKLATLHAGAGLKVPLIERRPSDV